MDQVIAEVLPEDKAKKVSELQAAGRKVAMVGDGVTTHPPWRRRMSGSRSARHRRGGRDGGRGAGEERPGDVSHSIQLARKVRGRSSRTSSGRPFTI